jgi:hypothetical protein
MPPPASCAINERSMRAGALPWLLGLALGWAWAPSAARAQAPAAFAFEWGAPEGCPSAALVQAEIDGLLGGAARDRVRQDLAVKATVARAALWQVTLATQAGAASGHRTIEAATCQGLASATALIVALMIDPDAVAAHASQAKAPNPEPPRAAPAPAPPALSAARATFGLAGLGAAGHVGVLPGPDVGLGATIGLLRGPWRVELRGAYGARQVPSDAMADAPSAHGKFRFFAGTLAGCWLWLGKAVDLGPCAEAEIGVVRGAGAGADTTTAQTTPWLGLGAGLIVALEATPWLRFPVHLDAVAPLWRPHFVFSKVDGDRPIFRAPPLGGRLTAGAELRF